MRQRIEKYLVSRKKAVEVTLIDIGSEFDRTKVLILPKIIFQLDSYILIIRAKTRIFVYLS